MSEDQSPTTPQSGSAEAAPNSGTTASAPTAPGGSADGQTHGQDSTAPMPQTTTGGDTFFDPSNLAPELLPAYKQMQAAFTNKTTELAQHRQKIQAYDQFMADPVGNIQRMAAQYGLHLTRAQAAQELSQQQQQQNWEPQTWEEVMSRAEERAEQRVMQRLGPYLGQVQQIQAGNVEAQLTKLDPNWKQYEPKMRELLQQHPSLVNDVTMLYRMAVPPEAIEAKAYSEVIKKYEGKAQHSNVTQGGVSPKSTPGKPKISSFEDAVNAAKQQINSGG